jgi:hypothetical protein
VVLCMGRDRKGKNHDVLSGQDGVELGDVELPPWAAGSPDEFVRVHREVSISQL